MWVTWPFALLVFFVFFLVPVTTFREKKGWMEFWNCILWVLNQFVYDWVITWLLFCCHQRKRAWQRNLSYLRNQRWLCLPCLAALQSILSKSLCWEKWYVLASLTFFFFSLDCKVMGSGQGTIVGRETFQLHVFLSWVFYPNNSKISIFRQL